MAANPPSCYNRALRPVLRLTLLLAVFAWPLPAARPGQAATAPSGIRGVVVIGPTCPVERDPPDPACAPRPYPATIAFRLAATNRLVATVRSDRRGRFTVRLAPGRYWVVPAPGAAIARPVVSRRTANVLPGRLTPMRIEYDSGIR